MAKSPSPRSLFLPMSPIAYTVELDPFGGGSSPGAVVSSSPSFDAARKLAYWLDAGIRIPGTNLRVGVDPILGLIPGVGDAAGAVLAGWILVEAYRLGASRATLVRIAGNVALDAGLGAIPLLGDIF